MNLRPEVIEIDVLLAEYGALCYLRAMGKKTAADVEDFRRMIVERIHQREGKEMSVTNGLRGVVKSVVDGKVHNGEMFTAHDVTLECRSRSHKTGHHEVRDAVHDYFQRGGMGVAYTRTTITVPSGGVPWLYHRTVDDPATYGNIRGQGMVPNPSVNTITIPDPSTLPDGDDDEDHAAQNVASTLSSYTQPSLPGMSAINTGSVAGVALTTRKSPKSKSANKNKLIARAVDSRSTLSLPSPLVRAAGFRIGDKVYASGVNGEVEVTNHPTSAALCKTYTVDCHNHVRITQSLLKRAGIGGDAYDVSEGNSKIVVRLHK